jgi:hypothetical protein
MEEAGRGFSKDLQIAVGAGFTSTGTLMKSHSFLGRDKPLPHD